MTYRSEHVIVYQPITLRNRAIIRPSIAPAKEPFFGHCSRTFSPPTARRYNAKRHLQPLMRHAPAPSLRDVIRLLSPLFASEGSLPHDAVRDVTVGASRRRGRVSRLVALKLRALRETR